MKVYVVKSSDGWIIGVYSTKEKAKEKAEKHYEAFPEDGYVHVKEFSVE